MADPTPKPDIPDPSSSTPGSPNASTVGGGSKKIRSMPDRPPKMGLGKSIRSSPLDDPAASRSQGVYADSFQSGEVSWRRGLSFLWFFFIVWALAEVFNASFYLLAGHGIWPQVSAAARVGAICLFFLCMWAGWSWTRYLLATVDFLYGAWLLIQAARSKMMWPLVKAGKTSAVAANILSPIESYPYLILGLVLLVTAGYVAFSIDVLAFTRHRKEAGRAWSALLVGLLLFALMAGLLYLQPLYLSWLRTERTGAQAFGEESLRAVSAKWEPADYRSRATPDSWKRWGNTASDATFQSLAPLGSLQSAVIPSDARLTEDDLQTLRDPVAPTSDVVTGITKDGEAFQVVSAYNAMPATFAHGNAGFGMTMVRDLFGQWQLIAPPKVANVKYDKPPASPTPPAPLAPPPGTPVTPDASPALSAPPAPGAAPSVPVAPAPTIAPPPSAAVATPAAATPAPSAVP